VYYKDIRARRNVPQGQLRYRRNVKKDFIRFNANPQPRSFTYAVTQFKQGKYSVVLHENFTKKSAAEALARAGEDEINPNYPILAWDGKGTRLACCTTKKARTKFLSTMW
jgi:hypothetical protein